MNRYRALVYAAALSFAAAIAIYAAAPSPAFGQDTSGGMARFGTVEIKNETEYQLFWSLLCRCGCPRETLGTCTCGVAHNLRAELREALAAGKSVEELKTSYAERFGTEAVAVPPNSGSQRAVWLAPLVAIVLGAGLVGVILRRWVKRWSDDDDEKGGKGGGGSSSGGKGKETPRAEDDESDAKYDRRLDDELKALDKE